MLICLKLFLNFVAFLQKVETFLYFSFVECVIVPWLRDPFLNPVLFLLVAVSILLLSLFLLYMLWFKLLKGILK